MIVKISFNYLLDVYWFAAIISSIRLIVAFRVRTLKPSNNNFSRSENQHTGVKWFFQTQYCTWKLFWLINCLRGFKYSFHVKTFSSNAETKVAQEVSKIFAKHITLLIALSVQDSDNAFMKTIGDSCLEEVNL